MAALDRFHCSTVWFIPFMAASWNYRAIQMTIAPNLSRYSTCVCVCVCVCVSVENYQVDACLLF